MIYTAAKTCAVYVYTGRPFGHNSVGLVVRQDGYIEDRMTAKVCGPELTGQILLGPLDPGLTLLTVGVNSGSKLDCPKE